MPALRALPFLRLAALAALIFPATQTAFAQQQGRRQPPPQLVESVNITGLRLRARAELLSHVETKPGDPYDFEQMMRDFQTLMNLDFFDRRVSRVVTETGQRGGVEIFFELQELPVIASVRFEGLAGADDRPLLEGLRRRGLPVDGGSAYEPDKIARAMEAVRELLRGSGWGNVEVHTRVKVITTTSVELTFVVTGLPPKKLPEPKRLDRPARRPDAIA